MLTDQRPVRLLIIDDDPADRENYLRCLDAALAWNFDVVEADSAEAGVAAATARPPDCILLDYHLPDMDGLETLARLQEPSQPCRCAIVMLTAYGGESLAVEAMKAGAMDYLPKRKVDSDTLPRVIEKAIEKFQMQRQIEEQRWQLEMSARRHQVLLEAMPQMVWTADEDGAVVYANRRWSEYTGTDSNSPARLEWDRLLHPDDCERTRQAWKQAVVTGSVFEVEHRLRRASDGTYRWHLVRAVPLRNSVWNRAHWFGTCTEIEDQRQDAETRLERQKFETIGRLAGGIAHDFNNLLVAILGGATIAIDHLPTSHSAREPLEAVIFAGERAAQLTRQLLAYAGKSNFFVEQVQVDRVVTEVCRRLSPSLPRNIHLELEASPELPSVGTDLAQLQEVVLDLVTNAREAMSESGGTIRIRTRAVDLDEELIRCARLSTQGLTQGKYVTLEIEDSGCGMEEEIVKKIFDPFFTTKSTGRGLALAGVKGFVRSNRGAIEVDSHPGKGSRFRVWLPALQSGAQNRNATTAPREAA